MTLPRISIVTPSYNQASFLEATLRSVIDQRYPNLEYIVMDDGSTDGSVEIIRRHESSLAHWQTAANRGQYKVIIDGLGRSTGEVMGWLNSDDMHTPWTLRMVGEIFARFPEVEWISSLFPLYWDVEGRLTHCVPIDGFSKRGFRAGEHLPRDGRFSLGFIQQESTFWRRSLWERSGGLDPAGRKAGDFDLWARFYQHAELYGVAIPLAGFRFQPNQFTKVSADAYMADAEQVLARDGAAAGALASAVRRAVSSVWARRLGLRDRYPMIRYNPFNQTWELRRS